MTSIVKSFVNCLLVLRKHKADLHPVSKIATILIYFGELWNLLRFPISKEHVPILLFRPLDQAAVVIVFGFDGRVDLAVWNQLNNSKTVRDRPYVSIVT